MSKSQTNRQPIESCWDEANGWRQGSVLPEDAALTLGILQKSVEKQFAMVVTHDCDCVASPSREPKVEVVIGTIIGKLDGGFTYAKSTRTLHLRLSACDKLIELQIAAKLSVLKTDLEKFSPDVAWTITREEKRILARCLSARYDRASFPTELVDRLKRVKKSFHTLADQHGRAAVGIFVDFDPKEELENSGEPYTLEFLIVFDETEADARERCTHLAEALRVLLTNQFLKSDGTWDGIELLKSEAVSDTEFTFREAQTMSVFQLDELSFKTDPHGALPK